MFGFGFGRMRKAVMEGDLATVTNLLTRGARPDATDSNGYTALHVAAINDQSEIVTALVRAGADPNIPDRDGTTPFMLAVMGAQPNALEALLDAGARFAPVFGEDPVAYAERQFQRHQTFLNSRGEDIYSDPQMIRLDGTVTLLRRYRRR